MDFVAPKKYMDLLARGLDGEDIDPEELENAAKEYLESAASASSKTEFWEEQQSAADSSAGIDVIKVISAARKDRKSKLAPLGLSSEEAKGGR
jgi:hypothetical protein